MPDAIFSNPRLAQLYDLLDPDRRDLLAYVDIAHALKARTILDVGCGTGTLACLLAASGYEVTALDPAAASLELARAKPHARAVTWLEGDASTIPILACDLVTMTGNVAQVFVTDEAWFSTLASVRAALRPEGWFVFEVREPASRAWESWNPEESRSTTKVPGVGLVETWVEVTQRTKDLVSFRWFFRFENDGALLTSDSTLRFRTEDEVRTSLDVTGFEVVDLRDAPDRPGLELVFVARRRPHAS